MSPLIYFVYRTPIHFGVRVPILNDVGNCILAVHNRQYFNIGKPIAYIIGENVYFATKAVQYFIICRLFIDDFRNYQPNLDIAFCNGIGNFFIVSSAGQLNRLV